MIEILKYSHNMGSQWDGFVQASKNGTIFHTRKFLSYHISREFNDHSLCFKKKNKLIAVFPAAIIKENNQKILFSHPGASFGGLVVHNNLSMNDLFYIIDKIEDNAKKNNIQEIRIIPTPLIYNHMHDESLLYGLKWKNYLEKEQYYSSIIPINANIKNQCELICKKNNRSHDFYDKIIKTNNLAICWDDGFDDFYSLLVKDKKKHGAIPTHSLKEIKNLKKIIPNSIKLLTIKKNTQILGGSLLFIANSSTAIIFYNSINYDYSVMQIATIQVIETIKWAHSQNLNLLDFGVSHKANTDNPLVPKMSLIKFKEKFNSFGTMRFLYTKIINE